MFTAYRTGPAPGQSISLTLPTVTGHRARLTGAFARRHNGTGPYLPSAFEDGHSLLQYAEERVNAPVVVGPACRTDPGTVRQPRPIVPEPACPAGIRGREPAVGPDAGVTVRSRPVLKLPRDLPRFGPPEPGPYPLGVAHAHDVGVLDHRGAVPDRARWRFLRRRLPAGRYRDDGPARRTPFPGGSGCRDSGRGDRPPGTGGTVGGRRGWTRKRMPAAATVAFPPPREFPRTSGIVPGWSGRSVRDRSAG